MEFLAFVVLAMSIPTLTAAALFVFFCYMPPWEFIHNTVAHPLMALTLNSRWSVRFHDWTGVMAWGNEEEA
jgi:hypothetical protein